MKTFGKKKKAPLNGDIPLQITSMADVFTIILVFLLKSFSTSVQSVSPGDNMTLPVGKNETEMKDTLKVEVSASAILVDQKEVLRLRNFEPPKGSLKETGESEVLTQAFTSERANQPIPNGVSNLLVLADEKTPYATIKTVLASAANSGFVDLQLVIVQEED